VTESHDYSHDLPLRCDILVNSEGAPVAVMVSLKPAPTEAELVSDWEARWDALAQKVGQAWKSEKSAVEILMEMRQ